MVKDEHYEAIRDIKNLTSPKRDVNFSEKYNFEGRARSKGSRTINSTFRMPKGLKQE